MKLINPNEIGSKISTLIAESHEKFIAVSPYIDISEWKKILTNLNHALDRGVTIEFYFRELREKDFDVLTKLGIRMYQIDGLHTKMFFNDSTAVVTSMNLYEYSDLHSIDIAMQFEGTKQYNEIFHYFSNYIKTKTSSGTFITKISERKLYKLHHLLTDRFSEFRISSTNTYLFSKNLIPIFHLFIDNLEIGLKYPVKNLNKEKIDEITHLLDNEFGQKFKLKKYNTTKNTEYCKWVISIEDHSSLDIVNLITDLQQFDEIYS